MQRSSGTYSYTNARQSTTTTQSTTTLGGALSAIAGTAGALQSLDKALGFTDSTQTVTGQNINPTGSTLTNSTSGVATSQAANAFQKNLLKNISNNIAGSAIDAAINGKPFDEKSLSTALTNGLITAGMAQGANSIGDGLQNGALNDFTHKVAHAVLGCAGGAAIAGNGSGCSAGAVGAVVGELASSYALTSGMSDKDATAFAKVIAATSGVLVGGGGDNAAAVNIANTTGANAAEYNRLLHKTETQKAAQLTKLSAGKYTQKQIEDAMRNSGNTAYNETVTSGMVNPGSTVQDSGAVFNVGGDGKTIVQTLPNGGKVDAELAAFIVANTGGANSPYGWSDGQTGKVTPTTSTPSNPFAAGWNYMGASSAGMASGVSTDNRTQAQIDASLNQTTTGIATAPLWVPMVGGAAMYSPLGFGLGAVGDAAGQAYQSYTTTGEVAIRPTQSVFSGVTGAIALPLAGRLPASGLKSISGAIGLVGNATIGGITGAANTQFNNMYYDDPTSLYSAFALGAFFGATGSAFGAVVSRQAANVLPRSANIPVQGPIASFAPQGTVNPLPTKIGNTVSNTVGAVPAFIPLDNGKSSPVNNPQEQAK